MCTTAEFQVESATLLQTPPTHTWLSACASLIYFPSGISLHGHPLCPSNAGEKVGKAKHGKPPSLPKISNVITVVHDTFISFFGGSTKKDLEFLNIDDRALEQIAQWCFRVSLTGDIREPSGCNPVPRALGADDTLWCLPTWPIMWFCEILFHIYHNIMQFHCS